MPCLCLPFSSPIHRRSLRLSIPKGASRASAALPRPPHQCHLLHLSVTSQDSHRRRIRCPPSHCHRHHRMSSHRHRIPSCCRRIASCRHQIPSYRRRIASRRHQVSSSSPRRRPSLFEFLALSPSPYYECQADGTPYLG
jgi:hypothetical protein